MARPASATWHSAGSDTDLLHGANGERFHVESFDVLRGDPAPWNAVFALKRASYQAASHRALDLMSIDARLSAYVDHAFDTSHYNYFNEVFVVRDDTGRPVAVAHGFVRLAEIAGRPIEIIRGNSCVLPSHRGLRLSRLSIHRLIRSYSARHVVPFHSRVFAGYCMHPMMYAFIDRRARRLVPRSGATDTQLQAVFDAVFGNDVNAQGVVPEHAGSKDSASTRAWLDTHRTDPAVAFFLKHNPQYDQGYALPVVMGLDGGDFLYTVGQFARIAMRKAVT